MNPTHFLLCPTCARSVPSSTHEIFCANDGTRLLSACPGCGQAIRTPFARHCTACGLGFATLHPSPDAPPPTLQETSCDPPS